VSIAYTPAMLAEMWGVSERSLRKRARELSPHSCRHGFATGLLQAGVDPVTVAKLGGWKGVAQLWATYGHAREDRTLTDLLTQQKGVPHDPEKKQARN
jgi:integrase